ncbi:hypothetical protein U9M48_013490 [Paspalum notatum var. saurae]|uniref:Uncharacterized protein n=1 Tax=Paspalum notatum var. saurae TaxID=547442 RepID=A0AAQ3WJS0_PASNO
MDAGDRFLSPSREHRFRVCFFSSLVLSVLDPSLPSPCLYFSYAQSEKKRKKNRAAQPAVLAYLGLLHPLARLPATMGRPAPAHGEPKRASPIAIPYATRLPHSASLCLVGHEASHWAPGSHPIRHPHLPENTIIRKLMPLTGGARDPRVAPDANRAAPRGSPAYREYGEPPAGRPRASKRGASTPFPKP